MPEKDYYKILNVQQNANTSEITRAYRILAKKYHPDKLSQELIEKEAKEAEEKFKDIAQAYEILRDPDKRREYDFSRAQTHSSDTEHPFTFTSSTRTSSYMPQPVQPDPLSLAKDAIRSGNIQELNKIFSTYNLTPNHDLFLLSLESNQVAIIFWFIARGIDVNDVFVLDYHATSYIEVLIKRKNIKSLKTLINLPLFRINDKTNIYIKNRSFNLAPLGIAIYHNDLPAIELLINSGASLQNIELPFHGNFNADYDYIPALIYVASKGYSETLLTLLNNGMDINVTDRRDRNALYYAAKEPGNLKKNETTKILLQSGINVNKLFINEFGVKEFALTIATQQVSSDSLDLIRMFLDPDICEAPTTDVLNNVFNSRNYYRCNAEIRSLLEDYKKIHFRFNFFLLEYSKPKFPNKEPWYSFSGLKQDFIETKLALSSWRFPVYLLQLTLIVCMLLVSIKYIQLFFIVTSLSDLIWLVLSSPFVCFNAIAFFTDSYTLLAGLENVFRVTANSIKRFFFRDEPTFRGKCKSIGQDIICFCRDSLGLRGLSILINFSLIGLCGCLYLFLSSYVTLSVFPYWYLGSIILGGALSKTNLCNWDMNVNSLEAEFRDKFEKAKAYATNIANFFCSGANYIRAFAYNICSSLSHVARYCIDTASSFLNRIFSKKCHKSGPDDSNIHTDAADFPELKAAPVNTEDFRTSCHKGIFFRSGNGDEKIAAENDAAHELNETRNFYRCGFT